MRPKQQLIHPPAKPAWLILALALAFSPLSAPSAQLASNNRVLELDGKGSYVQLPPNTFNEPDEATEEAWTNRASHAIRLCRGVRWRWLAGLAKLPGLEVRRRSQSEGAVVGQRQVNAAPRRPRFQPARDIHGGDQPVQRLAPMLREEREKVRQLLLEFLQFRFGQVTLDLDQENAVVRAVGAADHVELLFRPISSLSDAVRDRIQVEILGEGSVERRVGQALGKPAELVAQPADLLAKLTELPIRFFVMGHQRGNITSRGCHQVFQLLIGHANKLSGCVEPVNARLSCAANTRANHSIGVPQ